MTNPRPAARRACIPETIEFPEALPVSAERETIARLIASHQVVIVCGETGSGKTTQLPKLCLSLGRGATRLIGHTQPRRLAARAVAARIGEELGQPELVGHKVRFQDATRPENAIRLMTDGILLAEAQRDPDLAAYDTIIIDEAHERSLNIDFLLGYLKRLLPRRPDLKVIITSATIDPDSFARHFDDAPVIRVGGRAYPVEIRYRPLETDDQTRDLETGVAEAVRELWRVGPGDVLVFLPGQRQILDVARALERELASGAAILPLYGRLSQSEQDRIFRPDGRGRRVVLATNVAETSLTVPGIRYVVDSGDARINRYSHHSGVQQLLIERVSQASADQRAGRCGRLGPGVCIRLYSETDHASRPVFTTPEIRRANLAGVILQMHSLALGEIGDFPFLEPPERRYVNDGYRLLEALGAMDDGRTLTRTGRALARLPLDPRIGRIALAARDSPYRAAVLVLAAALSVQDPREQKFSGDQDNTLWHHQRSDFLGICRIWQTYQAWVIDHSRSQARKRCLEAGLSYLRMREWEATYRQICKLLRCPEAPLPADLEPGYAVIHQCLLVGLIDHIGVREEGHEYHGPRGRRFYISPGSSLFKRSPQWIVSAELVRTSRVFARTNARVEPQWIERAGAHLVQREHVEPRWDKSGGRVVATERVVLYGLLLANRTVNYGPVDPEAARELFIRHALVNGEFRHRGRFFEHNQALIEEIRALEAKTRRPDLLAHEDEIFEFYERRLPADIHGGRAFEGWRRRAEREQPRLLFMDRVDVLRTENLTAEHARFPDELIVNGQRLALRYALEPGTSRDGVTVQIPVAALNSLHAEPFEWLVPGLLGEKIEALIRSLAKSQRRHFVPAPDFARACHEALVPTGGSLRVRLAERLRAMTGVDVTAESFHPERLPAHLHTNFRVIDEDGDTLGEGDDLAALQRELAGQARARFKRADTGSWERHGLTAWDFPDLPERVRLGGGAQPVFGYPALVSEEQGVGLRIFDAPEAAAGAHRAGVRALFLVTLPEQVRYLRKRLEQAREAAARYAAVGGDLAEEIPVAAAERVFAGGDVRTRVAFERHRDAARAELVGVAETLTRETGELLARSAALRIRLEDSRIPAAACRDMSEQLTHLVYPGFVHATPASAWARLPVYLQGLALRLERLGNRPQRDSVLTADIRALVDAWATRAATADADAQTLDDLRWRLEELRLSLFAQELKALGPVSIERLRRALDAV